MSYEVESKRTVEWAVRQDEAHHNRIVPCRDEGHAQERANGTDWQVMSRVVTVTTVTTPWVDSVPEHVYIAGGPKNSEGQLDPRPRCSCGEEMPVGIKTSPWGWFTSHTRKD